VYSKLIGAMELRNCALCQSSIDLYAFTTSIDWIQLYNIYFQDRHISSGQNANSTLEVSLLSYRDYLLLIHTNL